MTEEVKIIKDNPVTIVAPYGAWFSLMGKLGDYRLSREGLQYLADLLNNIQAALEVGAEVPEDKRLAPMFDANEMFEDQETKFAILDLFAAATSDVGGEKGPVN